MSPHPLLSLGGEPWSVFRDPPARPSTQARLTSRKPGKRSLSTSEATGLTPQPPFPTREEGSEAGELIGSWEHIGHLVAASRTALTHPAPPTPRQATKEHTVEKRKRERGEFATERALPRTRPRKNRPYLRRGECLRNRVVQVFWLSQLHLYAIHEEGRRALKRHPVAVGHVRSHLRKIRLCADRLT